MNNRFPTIAIFITATSFTGFALWLGLNPGALLTAFGIESHVSSASEGDGLTAAVEIHARPGDVLAMRPLISHSSGSSKPGTQRHRRILHLEFAASAKPSDAVQWHDFIQPSSSQTSASQ